jgi:abortive infection bacteriophage resistance protein
LVFGPMRILDGFFNYGGYVKDYTKPPLIITEQIKLLKSRGLIISDINKAEDILSQINYYRLSAYCLPFESARDVFKSGVTLENVKELYEFDRCLRFLIDEALEVIEISLRSKIAYYLSHTYGPFAHENSSTFFCIKGFSHSEWLEKVHEEIERSKETFVQHYKHTYTGFPKIPIWMAVEVMSFGSLSKIFHNLLRKDQIQIAQGYGLHHRILASWLHTFTYVRNICAHHKSFMEQRIIYCNGNSR